MYDNRQKLIDRLKWLRKMDQPQTPSPSQPVFHQMANLANNRLNDFFRNLAFLGINNEYEKVRNRVNSETGDDSLLKNPTGFQELYEMKDGFDEYTYLAAFEVLFRCFYKYDDSFRLHSDGIEMGERVLFKHENYMVKCHKRKRKTELEEDSFRESDGIIEIIYYSPDGSFSILQHEPETFLYTLWCSEDMSSKLFKLLCRVLDKTFKLKEGNMIRIIKESKKIMLNNEMININ